MPEVTLVIPTCFHANNSIMIQLLAAAMARIHKILTEMQRGCLEKGDDMSEADRTEGDHRTP